MTMTTERHCRTLESLDRTKAVRAIHEALLQIQALDSIDADALDFENVKASLRECLRDAGHTGFTVIADDGALDLIAIWPLPYAEGSEALGHFTLAEACDKLAETDLAIEHALQHEGFMEANGFRAEYA